MKLRLRSIVNVALGAGLILIFLSIATSYITINALIRSAEQETQTQETVVLLEAVASQLRVTESMQRRYLLTNTSGDLGAYQQARQGLQQSLPRLHGVHAANSEVQDWRTLESGIAGRIALLDQAVVARQETGLAAATALIGGEQSRQLYGDIEALADRIKHGETLDLERSKAGTRQNAQTVKRLILMGGLLSLGILMWAILMTIRSQVRHRLIQVKLTDSEAMSRAVTESMAEGVVTATQDGIIVNANSAARNLFGYRLDEMVGHPVAMLMPVRYQMGFTAFFGALIERPSGFKESDTQVLGQRGDGSEFPVKVSVGDVVVGGRRLFTAIIRDVTESKRAAEALRDSEAQLRQLTDSVPALIAYVDKHQRFQFHNRAYEEAFGLKREQIQGKTLREVMGDTFYTSIRGRVLEVLAGYSVRYEREQVVANGERREYVMSYFPRYGEDEEEEQVIGYFSLGTDVSELKRIDRMKSEFVSAVSHELRTPLTSIRGSLGLVWGGVAGELPEKAKGLIGIAKNNCERLIRLINDILDSEKIASGKMSFELQPVDLAPLMEQVVAANEGFAAQHSVKLVLDLPLHPMRVNVDSDRLTQVVTNLLSNAIKFSPADGVVRVVVRHAQAKVRVEIRDSGPGIPDEFRNRIFQKFSQADSSDTRQKGGTGLGLNISKAILERMDGSIGFSSELKVGSTFFFELPEWRDAPPVTAPMGLDGITRPRILVCEDDPDVAQLIGMMLDKGGFDADVAHTAAQARDYLLRESYAAMTVDVKLPYENGLELIRQLRHDKRTMELPILVLSVTAADVRLSGGHEVLAVSDWLEKPIDEQRLLRSLWRAIESRRIARRA